MEERANVLIAAAFMLLLSANIVFLDIAVFGKRDTQNTATSIEVAPSSTCSAACTDAFAQYVATSSPAVQSAVTPTPSAAGSRIVTTPRVSTPKEYYIPLGSGTTKSDSWEMMAGMETTIDTALYPNIKSVTFEGHLRIPVGIGWMHVKLYNETDGHDVWGSELMTESDTADYKSVAITLDAGNKRYTVRAMSTIRAQAYLDNARIKIVTY